MAGASVRQPVPVAFEDVQAIVRFAHGKLVEARYLLVRVRDLASARRWCARAPVTNAVETSPPPERALQVGLTIDGLRAFRVGEAILSAMSSEFISGMCGSANRSLRLGDVGESAPAHWQWGVGHLSPHLIVMAYAKADIEAWLREVRGPLWDAAFETIAVLDTSNMGGVEPFGFNDGISQPAIDWQQRPAQDQTADYSPSTALGEFLLGYPNEYGRYTSRPLLDPSADAHEDLAPGQDAPDKRDLGLNGSYLVVRQLEQDVRGFWAFLNAQAGADPKIREWLGARLVGRQRDGQPLVSERAPNDFDYRGDPYGMRCPLGAHIRRSNPRSADLDQHPHGWLERLGMTLGIPTPTHGRDVVASARFHRVLRRGREYGQKITPEQALAQVPLGEGPSGLQFACLNASINRQFEFVQSAWLMSSKFGGLTGESDPLIGHRAPLSSGGDTDGFSIPEAAGLATQLRPLPLFVRVRGGAYFFLPSLRALRFVSREQGHHGSLAKETS
jgi:deferrochelatase/peroxidase EfeB